MNTKILTTHVGSLPRSKALSELLFAKDKGDSFSENEFDDVVKQNVSDIVKKQLDTGIDFVSDGEMSKISYATYVKDRINGFSGESERRAPADLDAFPEYKDKKIDLLFKFLDEQSFIPRLTFLIYTNEDYCYKDCYSKKQRYFNLNNNLENKYKFETLFFCNSGCV